MTFAAGLQGRGANEFSFEPSDLVNFNHGTALNPAIIPEFMCDTFVNQCAKSAATRDACKVVKADIDAQLASGTLARDQTYADAWLAGLEGALGVQSTGQGSAGAGAGAAAGDNGAGADQGGAGDAAAGAETGDGQGAEGNAAEADNAGAGQAAGGGDGAQATVDGIDVGPCTDFSMTFAAGQDNRAADEFSFLPTDLTNFNHGSALNPAIISEFMCDTLVNACAKSATTRDTCDTVKADIDAQLAAGTLARDQTYADAWLSGLETAFGIQSTGTGSGAGAGAGAEAEAGAGVGGTDANAGAADNAAGGAGAATGGAGAVNEGEAAGSAAGGATRGETEDGAGDNTAGDLATQGEAGGAEVVTAVGDNVQTFAGALNGVSAPAVNEDPTADRPFSVNGNTFLNKGAALQRSCAIQHNGCANAANSGDGDSSVAECGQQETECNAAATA